MIELAVTRAHNAYTLLQRGTSFLETTCGATTETVAEFGKIYPSESEDEATIENDTGPTGLVELRIVGSGDGGKRSLSHGRTQLLGCIEKGSGCLRTLSLPS